MVNVAFIPSLGRLVAGVSPRKTGSIPGRSTRDCLGTVWPGQVFLPELPFGAVTVFRPALRATDVAWS